MHLFNQTPIICPVSPLRADSNWKPLAPTRDAESALLGYIRRLTATFMLMCQMKFLSSELYPNFGSGLSQSSHRLSSS